MNPQIDLLFGLACIAYGVLSIVLRFTRPQIFGRLQKLKVLLGDTAGTVVHWGLYTVVPLAAGIAFVVRALNAG